MFEVRNLNVAYGQSQVLYGIDMAVAPGEIVALVGRNGMGKSTLMKSLIGVMPSKSGDETVDGTNVAAMPSHARVKCGLAYVSQGRQIFGTMTVKENIETGLAVTGEQEKRSTRCFRFSGSSKSGAAAITPEVSSNSSRLRARLPPIRRSCCSTSRPRAFSPPSSRISPRC
jgi:ABC-type branched-subunit amino acid transport system ATPase component